MFSERNRLVLSLAISAIMIVSAIAIRFTVNQASAQPGDHVHLVASPLLTENRNDLAFCIDAKSMPIKGNERNNFVEEVENNVYLALSSIEKHTRWNQLGYADVDIRVDTNCPGPPYALKSGAAHPLLSNDHVPVDTVSMPSRYRLHIYVLPDDVIDEYFSDSSLRSSPQEMMCEEDVCYEVTSAVYLTLEEAADDKFIQSHLEKVLAIAAPE